MEIEEAIRITRARASTARTMVDIHNGAGYDAFARLAARDAEALETVCDALEAFLKKQEEDASYHSK